MPIISVACESVRTAIDLSGYMLVEKSNAVAFGLVAVLLGLLLGLFLFTPSNEKKFPLVVQEVLTWIRR